VTDWAAISTAGLRGAGALLSAAGPLLPGPAAPVAAILGVATSVVAGLIEAGRDPVIAITEMESCLPEYVAAKRRLRQFLESQAPAAEAKALAQSVAKSLQKSGAAPAARADALAGALASAYELVADLADAGRLDAITEMESCLPDYPLAKQRLWALLQQQTA
jgi:hypothetical protein